MKKLLFTLFAVLATCLALQAEPVVKYYNDSTETQHADLEEITITSTRINNSGTLAKQEIKSEDLQLTNTGVNLPFLLQMTPSLVATSDDGLGIGYTYFRIRGTDHTRINTTVNGVPLNDSESQTVFWVNMTDIASSTNSVEVQRGVGTSTNGAAAFGASVNMQTSKAASEPYAQLSFNGGMYNTFREEAKIGTGIMPNGFAFDARVSKVNSDGYLERAYSDLLSYYTSGAWYGDQTMVKLLFFGGNETTYMAWDGVSADDLKTNRRYNPAGQYIDDDGNIQYDETPRLYGTAIGLPDDDADNVPVPYVIVTFDGLTNDQDSKDDPFESASDKVTVSIFIVAKNRSALADLAQAVRTTIHDYMTQQLSEDENFPRP